MAVEPDYPDHQYRDELTSAEWRRVRVFLARGAVAVVVALLFLMTIVPRDWMPMLDDEERIGPRPLRPMILGTAFGWLFVALMPGRIDRRFRVGLGFLLGLLAVAAHFLWA